MPKEPTSLFEDQEQCSWNMSADPQFAVPGKGMTEPFIFTVDAVRNLKAVRTEMPVLYFRYTNPSFSTSHIRVSIH
jgi:hypothetical protein